MSGLVDMIDTSWTTSSPELLPPLPTVLRVYIWYACLGVEREYNLIESWKRDTYITRAKENDMREMEKLCNSVYTPTLANGRHKRQRTATCSIVLHGQSICLFSSGNSRVLVVIIMKKNANFILESTADTPYIFFIYRCVCVCVCVCVLCVCVCVCVCVGFTRGVRPLLSGAHTGDPCNTSSSPNSSALLTWLLKLLSWVSTLQTTSLPHTWPATWLLRPATWLLLARLGEYKSTATDAASTTVQIWRCMRP